MNTVGRNSLCSCGSGLKYKNCCGIIIDNNTTSNKIDTKIKGLKPGVRMKGGTMFDPDSGKYSAIVHTWDNQEGKGIPKEWRSESNFETEELAMQYYKQNIRPNLERLMKQVEKEYTGAKSYHNKLEK